MVYALQLAEEIWIVHAFQKKSTQGIKTAKRESGLGHKNSDAEPFKAILAAKSSRRSIGMA